MKILHKYLLSEFIGTAVMMLIGVSAISLNFGTEITAFYLPKEIHRLILTAIMFAGGATLVVYSPVGKISGAHLNPVVSMAFWLTKKITGIQFLLFSVMQTTGSIVGSGIAMLLWQQHAVDINGGMTLPGVGYTVEFVFFTEILITFSLVLFILLFGTQRKLSKVTGLLVGLWVAFLVVKTARITGTSLNPARSFGPAFVMKNFIYIWVYMVAPVIGSLFAVGVMKLIKKSPICAKLYHADKDSGCLYHCEYK